MAVLLIALAVMSIAWTVAMPVWKQMATREKEAELVFRGEQYARAIGLYQRKVAGAFPANVDMLVKQRFLRRKYKDPITNGEFQLLYQVPQAAGPTPGQAAAQPAQPPPMPTGGATGPQGGIIGVTSKSKDKSIRLYKGRGQYNEWQFVFMPVTQRPGGAPGTPQPGAGTGGQRRPGPGAGRGPGTGPLPIGPGGMPPDRPTRPPGPDAPMPPGTLRPPG
jgi:hypothetical protein